METNQAKEKLAETESMKIMGYRISVDAHDILSVTTNGLVYHPPHTQKKGSKSYPEWNGNTAGGIGSGALGFWGSLGAYLYLAIKWSFILVCVGLALFGGKKFDCICFLFFLIVSFSLSYYSHTSFLSLLFRYFSKYQQEVMKKF
jgi:hypothetical protein